MTITETIIYSILQGLTEFLPVSSSGHLAVVNLLFSKEENPVFFFVILHLGTFFAVIVYFFGDIIEIIKGAVAVIIQGDKDERNLTSFRLIVNIAIATVLTALIVLPFKDFVENAFASLLAISINFCITGLLLLSTLLVRARKESDGVTIKNSIIIGIAQAIAVLPGVSRSGATISAGLLSGLNGEEAFRFSFLVALPAILGATILETPPISSISSAMMVNYFTGFIASFLSGLLALWFLRGIVSRGKLYYFSFYCLSLGILLIIYNFIQGVN